MKFSIGLAKTISWRVVASTITFVLVYIFSDGQAVLSGTLVAVEIITKMILYYLHDWSWFQLQGRWQNIKVSAIKTVTWRLIATATTTILSLVFIGEIDTSIKIGGGDLVVKMLFYFGHERIWVYILQRIDDSTNNTNMSSSG